VAAERTKPNGRIVGIDIIPAQPPKGVSSIQGNFLSADVQSEVKRFLRDPNRGRPRSQLLVNMDENKSTIPDPELSYVDLERHAGDVKDAGRRDESARKDPNRMVDVVLSDMMMNTSGIDFKDHAGSMDLCAAALQFCDDTLRAGGHFVCKFYQGVEDRQLEGKLKKMFDAVHREKPESSRSESKEAYFVALKRKIDAGIEQHQ